MVTHLGKKGTVCRESNIPPIQTACKQKIVTEQFGFDMVPT